MSTRTLAAVLAVLVVVFSLVYWPALAGPDYLDDHYVVEGNPLVASRDGWKRVLTGNRLTTANVFAHHYRPVALLSFWLTNQACTPSTAAHRLVNILIHLINALLVALLARRLLVRLTGDRDRALRIGVIAGAIFALHPIFTVTIHQVYKRTSSLAALFLLLGVICVLQTLTDTRKRYWPWALGVLLGVLAQLTKEHAAVYALLAASCLLVTGVEHSRGRVAAVLLTCAAPQVAILALTFPVGVLDRGWLPYLLAQPRVLLEYLAAFVAPSRVVLLSGLDRVALPPGFGPILGLLLVVVVLVAAWFARKRVPLVSFAVIWAAICLAPTSSVLPNPTIGDLARVYLAAVGVVILVATALELAGRRLRGRVHSRVRGLASSAPAMVVCLLCAAGAMQVNTRFLNRVDVWRHQVRLYPHHRLSNANLCAALVDARAYPEAISRCKTAEGLAPQNPFVVTSLVLAYARTGQLRAAEQVLKRAWLRMGEHWRITLALGHLRWFEGDLRRAESLYLRVLQSQPEDRAARLYLADTLLRLGQRARARRIVAGIDGRSLPGNLVDIWRDVTRKLR